MVKINALRNLFIFFLLTSFSSFAEEFVPEQLKNWEAWVLKDSKSLSCPFINQSEYSNINNHICAWPNVLNINVDQQGAEFQHSWEVLSKSIVPLLGNNKYWPIELKVNGKKTPILSHKNQPFIELEKGQYVIEGRLSWQEMPSSISLPGQIAQVNLSIYGQEISFPKIQNNQLWFQESTQGQATQETLSVRVVRKISDGPYIKLKTLISVDVSGKMREVALGQVLPKNFDLVGIQSETPAFLDADGVLHAKFKARQLENCG